MSLPDALKLTKFPRVGNMKVNTVVLEPQIAQNNFVRYVLERRGILDSDSVFTFALKVSDAAAAPATLPVNTGIAALIKNCTLRLGNQVISRTQDWAHFHTVASMFAMPEERSLKHVETKGTLSTLRPSLNTDGRLGLRDAVYTSKDAAVTPPQQDLTRDPVFMLKLSDLFPALKDVQLPLGHMQDHMVVEFELNSQASTEEGILGTFKQGHTGSTEIVPDYAQMTMLADHLNYSDETHQEIDDLVNGDGLVIPFHEIVTIQGQIPAADPAPTGSAVTLQTHVQELPLAGRVVKGILSCELGGGSTMSGAYRFQSPHVSPGYNLKVNDLNVYPRDVVDPAYKIAELEKVLRRPMAMNVCQYSLQIQGDGSVNNSTATNPNTIIGLGETFNGKAYDLEGGSYVEGVDLVTDPMSRRGTRILDKPIRYERRLTRTSQDLAARGTRHFCLVEKAFAIQRGAISVMA